VGKRVVGRFYRALDHRDPLGSDVGVEVDGGARRANAISLRDERLADERDLLPRGVLQHGGEHLARVEGQSGHCPNPIPTPDDRTR